MPNETPDHQGSVEAAATDAFIRAQIPEFVSETIPQSAQENTPDPSQQDLLAGRYKTVDELEEGYRHWQSRADQLQPHAERAQQYESLLNEIERNPALVDHIQGFSGEADAAAPETLSVTPKVDEFGVPTGEMEINPDALRKVIAQEAKAEAQRMLREESQQQGYQQQLAQLKSEHNLTDAEVDQFLHEVERPGAVNLESLYQLHRLNDEQARATNRGRNEVVDRIRKTQAKAPAIGATSGQGEGEKSIGEQMGDDILRVGAKTQFETEMGL